jgi:hypothetical protein
MLGKARKSETKFAFATGIQDMGSPPECMRAASNSVDRVCASSLLVGFKGTCDGVGVGH